MNFSKQIGLFVLLLINATDGLGQMGINIESGVVHTGHNMVQIPASNGTRLSINKKLNSEVQPFFRGAFLYKLKHKHNFVFLFAPLRIKYTGVLTNDLAYNNFIFRTGEYVVATYQFNSYRLTYAYSFVNSKRFEFKLGLTAKIRDAEISFDNNIHVESYLNTGFVGLFHIDARCSVTDKFSVKLVGDGLAVKYGRAEDFLLSFDYQINQKVSTYLGYRILEGGSDGSSVYTFALFHYGVTGAVITF